MKYDCTKPCANCPFRTDVRPYIHPSRVEEIRDSDAPFSCHKTTTEKGRSNNHPDAQHCAGNLILKEKEEQPDQMMRIAERIGFYDRRKLDMEAPVYDSWDHMFEAHEDSENKM